MYEVCYCRKQWASAVGRVHGSLHQGFCSTLLPGLDAVESGQMLEIRFEGACPACGHVEAKDLLRLFRSCVRARSSRVLTAGTLTPNTAAVSATENPWISRRMNTVLYSCGNSCNACRNSARSSDRL